MPTATYSLEGGVVTVACGGPFNVLIRLVSATPKNGYAVIVAEAGPRMVDVSFTRSDYEERVTVVCFGQPVRTTPPPDPPSSTTVPPP